MSLDLFRDILPSILQERNPVLKTEEEIEENYNPFLVNLALSYYRDCIFFVNEMNASSFLPKRMQHDFLFHGLRKYKRPFAGKWAKKVSVENMELIQKTFGFSPTKALAALKVLTPEQIDEIKKLFVDKTTKEVMEKINDG